MLARDSAVPATAHSASAEYCFLCELDRLHHLAYESIGEDDNGIAIAIGKLEGQCCQVGHFLHRVRREHDGAVVAVSSALDHLVIVTLLRGDVAAIRNV